MGRWDVGFKGFRLSVRTPGRPPRQSAAADGRLQVVAPAGGLQLRRRDDDTRAAFHGFQELAGGVSKAHAARSAASAELVEQVEAVSWYHTIELPGGIVTDGFYDHRQLVAHLGLPDDLHGKRALDLACFDGFWAFELERRGAEVVAFDLPDLTGVDMPEPVRRQVDASGMVAPTGAGFEVASGALGSRVRRVTGSLYDLDPAEVGTFDLVHIADVLLHLENPMQALRHVRRVTSGRAVIADCFDSDLEQGSGLVTYRGGWHNWTWWLPALDTLGQMIVDAGFRQVRLHTTYRLAPVRGDGGHWHAVFHADA